ncbi:MAG TPA: RNA polymerase sigma factor [Terriglobales bacterium]|nr:RNA polymerase sigma factor [Terriglobales bacterium]
MAAIATLQPDLISGDNIAQEIGAVFSRCWSSFYHAAFRQLGNAAEAEDAVQDALLSACKYRHQFRGQAQLSTWLTAIVINAARMRLRSRPRHLHMSLNEPKRDDASFTLFDRLPDPGPSPEQQCRASELADRASRFMAELSPPLRQAFQLRAFDGLPIREMAGMLGVPEGTVKARLNRARTKLRRLIDKSQSQRANSPSRQPSNSIVK